ncbi:MAG: TolB-like protein/Flp pilus assembly protein TadD [Rhodothermales bacterium]
MSFFKELKRRNVFRVGIAYGVAAWVLLQVADLVLENINAPEWVIQAMMLMVGLGFIAALVIAWAYEMTPEGIKKEADVDRTQSIAGTTGKKLNKVVFGFLVLAVAVLLFERSMDKGPSIQIADTPPPVPHISEGAKAELNVTTDLTSVAVLPFANMSADADNEFFSDGISEELLNLLVRVEGLRVPSRTSSFAFKGMNMDIKEIARQLEVGHILEGSVRKAGNQVRVTAQLIDVSTDTHLWSETYDRQLEDIFAIQDEIASHIVDALKIALGTQTLVSRADEKPTENLDAYQEYLRGRHLFMQRGLDSLHLSMQLLQSAVSRDPKFIEAWAQLSQTASTLHGWNPYNAVNANSIGIEAGLKALQLDPDNANAMAGLALAYYDQKRWREALDLFEKAESLATDSNPVYWYGLLLQGAGYLDEARKKFMAAEKMDPVYPQLQYWIGLSDMVFGRTDDARIHFQRAVDGSNPNGAYGMTWLSMFSDNKDEVAYWLNAVKMQAEAGSISVANVENFKIISSAIADPSLRDSGVKAAVEEDYIQALAYFGAFEEIFQVEARRLDSGNTSEPLNDMGIFFWSPQLEPLRQMPEFKELATELGLVKLWKSRGWPDMCRPVGDDDFECD